jgi:translation initiation factor IF-3
MMINEEIRDREVRLVDADGGQLGVVDLKTAMALAEEKHLDLVKIAPHAKPPVCKIIDYSKFRFEQIKKEKEARKKQKQVEIKEIRLSPNIDTHDIEFKAKKAVEFLRDGDKLKVSIRFRYGREISRTGNAEGIMRDFAASLAEYGVIEKQPKMEARTMFMFMAPKATDIKTSEKNSEAKQDSKR